MKDFVIEGTILKSYVGDDKDVTIPAGAAAQILFCGRQK